MTYIRITDAGIVWPYTRHQLLADNQNVSFRLDPSPEELEPFGVYIVAPTDPPEHDPALQQPVETLPVEQDGQWLQAWELRDLPPPPPVPNWAAFKRAMLASQEIKSAMIAAWPEQPQAVIALPSALERCERGVCSDFAACWEAIREAAAVPRVALNAIVAEAQMANLPADFISTIIPPV